MPNNAFAQSLDCTTKVIVFGAGNRGKQYIQECGGDISVLAVCDNNKNLWGGTVLGHPVVPADQILSMDYDRIVIALSDGTESGQSIIFSIQKQLINMGIPQTKIMLINDFAGNDVQVKFPRASFLNCLSKEFYEKNISGSVAECGVWRGDFAAHINKCFPDRKLYLFDTFEGFDSRDLAQETESKISKGVIDFVSRGNAEIAYMKMVNKDNVIIKKGYIPGTFTGLEDERFAFVNLDTDLYAPQLAALRFFSKRMVPGGVILVHDYFASELSGVKRAVDEFAKECRFTALPIGDERSLALTGMNPA